MTIIRVRFTPNDVPTPGRVSFDARHDKGNRPIVSGRDILNGNPEWVSVPVEGAEIDVRPLDAGQHYVVRVKADGHPQQTGTFLVPPSGPVDFESLVRYDPKAGMAYEPDPDWWAHLKGVENGVAGTVASLENVATEVSGYVQTAEAAAGNAASAALIAARSAVPPPVSNLIEGATYESGTLSPSGNVIAHESNVTTSFLPVIGGHDYVSFRPSSLYRIVWFDAAKASISGTDTNNKAGGALVRWVAPNNAAYVRIGLSISSVGPPPPDGMIFNRGKTLWEPGAEIRSGWWDGRELPPVPPSEIDQAELVSLVESMLPQYEPSSPTLQFADVGSGWSNPLWLSSDGEVLFGRQGEQVRQSTDEWQTTQIIHTLPYPLQAIRQLDNGELLASTARDDSVGRKTKLFLSTGYDRTTGTVTGFTEVLEALAPRANFNNSWGMHTYQNVVVVSEYGLRGEDGGRRVYMSEDYGQTWRVVFDQKTVVAPGRPVWTEQGHIHTAVWDPYWSRLWVVVGDNPNTASYYSDDKGVTWTFITGSDVMQYTGIMPLPDAVLFGSDRAPNGVHVYRRTQKADMPVIKPLLLIDDQDVLTRVFQLAFRRDWNPTTPTYFVAAPAADREPSVIVGTVDGRKAQLLWESEHPTSGGPRSGAVRQAFGPTAQGNIVAVMEAVPGVTGTLTLKAPAPAWARN